MSLFPRFKSLGTESSSAYLPSFKVFDGSFQVYYTSHSVKICTPCGPSVTLLTLRLELLFRSTDASRKPFKAVNLTSYFPDAPFLSDLMILLLSYRYFGRRRQPITALPKLSSLISMFLYPLCRTSCEASRRHGIHNVESKETFRVHSDRHRVGVRCNIINI